MGRNANAVTNQRVCVGTALPLMTDAVASLLESNGFAPADRHQTSQSAHAAMFATRPDIAVFDFDTENPSSLDLLRDARAAQLPTRIILFIPTLDGGLPIDAVELGVDGLLMRTASGDTVLHCVKTIAEGGQWLDPQAMKAAYQRLTERHTPAPDPLTRRERDVARLVATGQRNRVIAESLGISEGTVKMHLHNVYCKLGLESRTQLAMDVRVREMG